MWLRVRARRCSLWGACMRVHAHTCTGCMQLQVFFVGRSGAKKIKGNPHAVKVGHICGASGLAG